MEFTVVDPRQTSSAELAEGIRQAQTLFKLNHTMPFTEEYNELVKLLFGDHIDEESMVMSPLKGVCFDRV